MGLQWKDNIAFYCLVPPDNFELVAFLFFTKRAGQYHPTNCFVLIYQNSLVGGIYF